MINVVYNQLIFPLLSISKLYHVYSSSGAIETVEKFTFHLVPTIDTLRCKIYVLIEFIPSKRTNELFD